MPQINNQAPTERYEWIVLPQGMANSPTICQYYVDQALKPWKLAHPEALVYHYIDDILIATAEPMPQYEEEALITQLASKNLIVAPEKIQRTSPWTYLDMTVTDARIQPSKMQLHTEVNTVNDVQQLVGDIQWLHMWCGITNQDIEPLLALLRDSTDPTQPRQLTQETLLATEKIEEKIAKQQCYRYDPDHPLQIAVYGPFKYYSAVILQVIQRQTFILEWIFPPS